MDAVGRTGVVARGGDALRARRADDSKVIISVDDARAAAEIVNALADQRFDPE